ncbi:hypothetical protein CLU79DRAFT_687059, partial [Phycomyces nitens]
QLSGPGVWQFNTIFLDHDEFETQLERLLDLAHTTEDVLASPGLRWDALKQSVKQLASVYGTKFHRRVRSVEASLNRTHSRLICDSPSLALADIEAHIAEFQMSRSTNLAQQAGMKWFELGEQSNKYFFQTIKWRSASKSITSLTDPITNTTLTDTADILGHTRSFYHALYTEDPIDLSAAHSLLSNFP